MRIQPRQALLEIWNATVRTSTNHDRWLSSTNHDRWVWGGRRTGSSCLSDAQQLLCIMGPATQLSFLKLDRPDETADDVLHALRGLGDSVEIPRVLIRVIAEYMARYTDERGLPVFFGDCLPGPARDAPAPPDGAASPDRPVETVDSFATSVRLSLATIGFLRVFRTVVRRMDLRRDIDALEESSSARLTAAMVGLLRSFAIRDFDVAGASGRTLIELLNQEGLSARQVVDLLGRELRDVRARLQEITIGSGQAEGLENPNRLFECGWSWGVTEDAPRIAMSKLPADAQRDGVATAAPYLYFTVSALEGIEHLFNERTRILGLLNEEQQRLAQALQIRFDITQSYWSTLARFGAGRWPLEDLPWRTADGDESEYFSVLVTAMLVRGLGSGRVDDADLGRIGDVLHELASRGRVSRRPFIDDPAVRLHSPGVDIVLDGSGSTGPPLVYRANDYAPLVVQSTLRVTGLVRDIELRQRLLSLADAGWEHLQHRRLDDGRVGGLWDEPAKAFAQLKERQEGPSWSYTQRVVECVTTAAETLSALPLRSDRLVQLATELLNEAEHLFDQELLNGSTEAGPAMQQMLARARATLGRTRAIILERPGTAMVLASDVLRDLDRLKAARSDISGEI